MLPERVQRVFDEYSREQVTQQPKSDFRHMQPDLDYHYKQLMLEIRRERYIVMGITIAIGICQAIYFSYLFT